MNRYSIHPKLEQLVLFLAGRPVCLLGSGPSIGQLPEHLKSIPSDTIWVGHNVFRAVERILEDGLGRRLDIVYVSSKQTIEAYVREYRKFLERDDKNLLLTTTGGELIFNQCSPGLLKEFWNKVIVTRCEPGAPLPDHAFNVVQHPGIFFSFVFAILILLTAGVRTIVLFGIDGSPVGVDEATQWHYGRFEDYPNSWFREQPGGYGPEIAVLNSNWNGLIGATGINQKGFKIYNCNPNSEVTCFVRIPYSDLRTLAW